VNNYTPWNRVVLEKLRQELPHLVWNPKVHYHVHKSLPLDQILSLINPIHYLTPYFFKTYFKS
jgi:hypothetical protein